MKKLLTIAAALTALLFSASASAAVTATNVTTPTNPTFLNPDNDVAIVDLTVSGTAAANDADLVDIRCAYNGGTEAFVLEQDVPVNGGTFSAVVDQTAFSYYICRLIAVPANQPPPYNLSAFSGPVVGNGGFSRDFVSGGPNDGQLYNYEQDSSSPEGYWSVRSAGDCYVNDSYVVEPGSLDYINAFWGCSEIPQGSAGPRPLKIGGADAELPDTQDDSLLGFRGIADFANSIDPSTGDMRVSDTETPVICADAGCTSYTDSGLRLLQKQTGGTNGHTLAIEHTWVNDTAAAKQLDVTYRVETDNDTPGWRLPGEAGYSAHTGGDTVALAGPGPGSLFAANDPGDTCQSLAEPCGSVTWRRAPISVEFLTEDRVDLTYSVSVPANDSKVIGLTYSQGYPQSAVDGYAAAAEASYTPSTQFTVGKLKRNKKKGTVTLPVEVPGAGVLHADGKKVKTVDAQTTAAGTVKVLVAAKGKKPKKKLKKKGKLKVTVNLTFQPEDWPESSTQTKKPTLKKKLKKKGGKKK